jgi:hypothetical protein
MVQIRPIEDSMFAEIYETFLRPDDDQLRESDWKRLFVNERESSARRGGFALLENGKIAGILGAIYSERCVDGVAVRFCNLHSWYVLEASRGRGIFLLQKAIADRSLTLTDFTPTKVVTEISACGCSTRG